MDGWRIDRTRLRTLREDAGLTQTRMAELCGYHPRHYHRFESTRPWAIGIEPSLEMVLRVLAVLTEHCGREVTLSDIAERGPSRRSPRPAPRTSVRRHPRDAA